jgi:uracil-DNA glycosylase
MNNKHPRLLSYIEQIGNSKVSRFITEDYWAKPLPGFGDSKARLFVIELAPAAHGGNRTGRIFTGDSSGDWVVRAMFETGFANKPTSTSKNDVHSLFIFTLDNDDLFVILLYM